MDGGLTVSSWVAIDDGCPIRYEVLGSGVAHVLCGAPPDAFEFQIDVEALRQLIGRGDEALRKMDALYAEEQAGELT
jgi:hypothetical protein